MTSVQSKNFLQKAVSLQQAGKLPEATALFRRAAALSPGDALCGMALAQALTALGDHAEAEALLRGLAGRHPRHAELWDHFAIALQHVGRMADSLDASRRAVAANPAFVQGWLNLGLALLNTAQPAEALKCFQRCLSLRPNYAPACHACAMALQHLHRIPEAVAAYGDAIRFDPSRLDSRSYRLMALHYLSGLTRNQLWQEHQAYGAAVRQRGQAISNQRGQAISAVGGGQRGQVIFGGGGQAILRRKVRLAFLSPDLRDHSVAYFLEPLLQHIDREQFDVILYHDHFTVDAVSERLKGQAILWRNLVGVPDARAGEIIRGDKIDVLVELAGHTGLNRLSLLAGRVAPVQMTYLGYPDTTGVSAIDYRLVDAITDPIGDADGFASERLVRFAPTMWSYAPPASAPAPFRSAGAGKGIVFGSCNNLAKITDETLQAWGRLLQVVPGAKLVIKAGGLSETVMGAWFRARASAAGIDGSRLELADRVPDVAGHLAFYQGIDVALDSFPYHGTTTTCEALWMGVPVVSLQGDRHCARVGGSLLAAVGRQDWAVHSWDQYIAVAARVAAMPPDRASLRAAVARSALLDHAGQAARFGAALLNCRIHSASSQAAA